MKKHVIIHTADLHGSVTQYSKLFQYAKRIRADSLIIGGDITPLSPEGTLDISWQRRFLQKDLAHMAESFKRELPGSRLFIMMGNDDCAANMDALEKNSPELYHTMHNKRLKLNQDFDLVGYSCVPITPFGIKDWEKYDFSQVPKGLEEAYWRRKISNYNLSGSKTNNFGWQEFRFTPEIEKADSIDNDLQKRLFQENPAKTIYVFHTPPNSTNLDQIIRGFFKAHVGSMAVRKFIEKSQPYLTLHGHIHETVIVSGSFKDRIGKTICLAPGNHSSGSDLAVIVLDLYRPESAQRVVL